MFYNTQQKFSNHNEMILFRIKIHYIKNFYAIKKHNQGKKKITDKTKSIPEMYLQGLTVLIL